MDNARRESFPGGVAVRKGKVQINKRMGDLAFFGTYVGVRESAYVTPIARSFAIHDLLSRLWNAQNKLRLLHTAVLSRPCNHQAPHLSAQARFSLAYRVP